MSSGKILNFQYLTLSDNNYIINNLHSITPATSFAPEQAMG